jgi:uncharacterized protein YprB with RNaseH-like and TPR domain
MSLQNKLNRFKKELTHVGSEQRDPKLETKNASRPVEDRDDLWTSFDAIEAPFEDQYCIVREKTIDYHQKIGPYHVGDLYDSVAKWNDRKNAHPLSSCGRNAEDLLFFDTETTGLGTGAGNTIFLLGMARIIDEGIQVRQYFLPGPGNETALYHHFLSDVQDIGNLVTYNGKAFDWPQVKTRHTFVRHMVPKLPSFGHFDLLHASRRIWKKSYESLRLSVVEQEILQIERQEDTPGYLAPMLYFEYLREKDPEILREVFEHNELDVLTLVSLYTHLSNVILDENHPSLSVTEQYEVAKWFEAVEDASEAKVRYEQLLATSQSCNAKKALARLYKKEKKNGQAEVFWKSVLEEREDPEACIELSKIYEHEQKDFEKALFYAEKGYHAWKNTNRIIKKNDAKDRAAFDKRIERLERKTS